MNRWDSLDVQCAIEALLEGFSENFYGASFGTLRNRTAARILAAFAEQFSTMLEAQKALDSYSASVSALLDRRKRSAQ